MLNDHLTALHQIDWDFPHSRKTNSIHNIHPYPAKFISEIPQKLIETIGAPKGTWVLDPFCGSGATLVEAQLAGIPSAGIDINPIACLISKVKTQQLNNNLPLLATKAVTQAKNKNGAIARPSIPNLDHWFKPGVQEEIARLLSAIERVEDVVAQDALKLALSSILVKVSNQDSDTRYAAVEKPIKPGDVYRRFLLAVERIWQVKSKYKPKTWQTKILRKNILEVQKNDLNIPVGLVVTSPPYPNAYEYWLYHKYRMFWLGYDPLDVKKNEIGARAHYFKKKVPTTDDFKKQMSYVLSLSHSLLVDKGYACIIIGRSKIHGKIIDNASIIIDAAQQAGFTLAETLSRRIALNRKSFNLAHANIKTEHILVFAK